MAEFTNDEAFDFVTGTMRPANQMPTPHYFGLHLGPPGSGKTHTLGTMPGKTLILDCRDGGSGTAPLVDQGDRITVVAVTSWMDLRKAITFLGHGQHEFESVGIDGLSKLQSYDQAYIIENAPVRKDGSKPVSMELDMWGIALDHFQNFVNHMEAIAAARNLNVAMTAWEAELTGDDGKMIALIPDLQGKIKNRIGGMFDIVMYHVTKQLPAEEGEKEGKTQFAGLTQPFQVRPHGKCRWNKVNEDGSKEPALSPIEINPNIGVFVEKIREGVRGVLTLKSGPVSQDQGTEAPAPPETATTPPPEQPPPLDPANVAAAKELEGSATDTTTPLPSHDQLSADAKNWYEEACKRYDGRADDIRAKVKEISARNGVAKLGGCTQQALALALEELMEYEEKELKKEEPEAVV